MKVARAGKRPLLRKPVSGTVHLHRIQRRIDSLLDDADQAIAESNWALVYERAPATAETIRHRPEIALAHLDFCIPEFRAMKMRPALERAERLRARLANT